MLSVTALFTVAVSQTIGPWAIEEGNEFCAMSAQTMEATQINVVRRKGETNRVIFRIGNKNWRSLAAGQKIKVQVLINGQDKFLKPVNVTAGVQNSWIEIPMNGAFARELYATRMTMAVFYQGRNILLITPSVIDIQAFTALSNCSGASDDPFVR